jgi:hypothetical protein
MCAYALIGSGGFYLFWVLYPQGRRPWVALELRCHGNRSRQTLSLVCCFASFQWHYVYNNYVYKS